MQSPITVTCAPCCWGVDDVKNPHLPPWERVLDEAVAAGFGGLELGPYGYSPPNWRSSLADTQAIDRLSDELRQGRGAL